MWGIKYDNWIGGSYKLDHWVVLPDGLLRQFATLEEADVFAEAMNKAMREEGIAKDGSCYHASRVI